MTRDRASMYVVQLVHDVQSQVELELLPQHSLHHTRICVIVFCSIFCPQSRLTLQFFSEIAWDSVADVVTSSLERVASVVAPQSVCLSSISVPMS